TFPAPTGTTWYCVRVVDTSNIPENVTTTSKQFTVNPTLIPPVISVSPVTVDYVGKVSLATTVSWQGGTPSYICQWLALSPTSVGTSAISSAITNCAGLPAFPYSSLGAVGTWKFYLQVKDNSSSAVTVISAPVLVTVNSAPKLALGALSLASIDQGQTATVTATANWAVSLVATGSPPYNVTLYGGSSATCSSDTSVIATAVRVAGSQFAFSFNSPSSTTQICARMVDSATPPGTASSAVVLFQVNPPLTLNPLGVSPQAIDTGQSTPLTVTVNWATTPTGSTPSGTGQYMVTLYGGSSPSCASDTTIVPVVGSNPLTGIIGAFSAAFTTTSPSATTYYCAQVSDSSSIPETIQTSTVAFNVNPAPVAMLTPLSPAAIDSGQNVGATTTLSWTGGTSPFKVQLFSGSSPSCASDTNPVPGTSQSGLTGNSVVIPFNASPTSTTYYCGQVTDGSSTPLTALSGSTSLSVDQRPGASVIPSGPYIRGGQSETLQAIPTLGVSPYTYQWFVGSGCSTGIPGQTSQTFSTGPIYWTTLYSVRVSDSSPGTPATDGMACASDIVTVTNGPSGMASDQATGMVYVANPSSNHITVISNSSKSVVATIPVGIGPWGVAVNVGANLIYVTNYGSGTISVINGATNMVANTIHIGTNLSGIALSPASTKMYVVDSGSDNVYVINTTTRALITTVAVGITPQGIAIGPAPTYTVFVTDSGSNTVTVIDSSYRATSVPVGNYPSAVAVNPATNKAYVTNFGSATVTVIDGATYSVVGTINVGTDPQSIVIDSAKGIAYVANIQSNTVSVINLATSSVTGTVSGLNGPWSVALLTGSPGLAYVSDSGTNTISVVEINIPSDTIIATIIVS
ncbi:MAG TPA: YncE family protein, partial [Nitrososphaerales archaeon]|nr:YncE family protein [Nitrososphaerales archaeon]